LGTANQRFADGLSANRVPHVAEADKVSAKTLIFWGRHDAICSLTAAKAIADALPDSELVLIDDCGHFPWIEKPDFFLSTLAEFLRS
jgi:proline iminopeptidase